MQPSIKSSQLLSACVQIFHTKSKGLASTATVVSFSRVDNIKQITFETIPKFIQKPKAVKGHVTRGSFLRNLQRNGVD